MIATYEPGNAPTCTDCRGQMDCDFTLVGCDEVRRGNELLTIAWQSAALTARIHDPAKRHYMADALADAWPDVMPAGWFDRADFLDACGCHERAKAVA